MTTACYSVWSEAVKIFYDRRSFFSREVVGQQRGAEDSSYLALMHAGFMRRVKPFHSARTKERVAWPPGTQCPV